MLYSIFSQAFECLRLRVLFGTLLLAISLTFLYLYVLSSWPVRENLQRLIQNPFSGRRISETHNVKPQLVSSENLLSGNQVAGEKAWRGEDGPPLKTELARIHASQTSRDMLLFLRYQIDLLQDLQKKAAISTELGKKVDELLNYTLDNMVEYESVINDQLKYLATNDGWSSWRKEEAMDLRETMKRRLHALQNPINCAQAPVLLCNLTSTSGFGSGLHDVLWCFVNAYYHNLRMVLVTTSWHYAPSGWATLFKPLSDNCEDDEGEVIFTGPGGNSNKARELLRRLPSDLGPRIIRIHSSPIAWWYGQFLGYLMRPNARLEIFLDNLKKKIGFNEPIVGVHVRRTDKAKEEAKAHSLEKYMRHVEHYFTGLELKKSSIKRRIYLATDDPKVTEECQNSFKKFNCISNREGALTASDMSKRYSNTSLWNVLADVFMLSNSDFLVCTFSSNLCRLVYELRHAIQLEDASDRFVSIDVDFYFANVSPPPRLAVYNHLAKSSREINFTLNDKFRKRNEWSVLNEARSGKTANGFAEFYCEQKQKQVLIPSFKTKNIYEFATVTVIPPG